ncbi:hypothetical protein PM082_015650 [Marasmius tenuissimus]|nr:hypothetical protein PM082_015650 [Marasmius tenuissimus]
MWMYLRDLVNEEPQYFRQFKQNLRDTQLEEVEVIPVSKSTQVHFRMVDSACSTPAKNGTILENLVTKQGGVGDPYDPSLLPGDKQSKNLQALGNHVILLFGDLGVGERVHSLLKSCAEEKTRWRRLQGIIYVLGLFHVKMACADAVWRIFIEPKGSTNESDEYSLMADIKILRPKETRKIKTKPGFRRMHEVI